MCNEHDLCGAVIAKEEDLLEHFHYKIHRRYIIVVDDDAIKRLEFRIDIFDDLDLWDAVHIHLIVVLVPCIAELGHFLFAQFDLDGVEIFLDVLRVE